MESQGAKYRIVHGRTKKNSSSSKTKGLTTNIKTDQNEDKHVPVASPLPSPTAANDDGDSDTSTAKQRTKGRDVTHTNKYPNEVSISNGFERAFHLLVNVHRQLEMNGHRYRFTERQIARVQAQREKSRAEATSFSSSSSPSSYPSLTPLSSPLSSLRRAHHSLFLHQSQEGETERQC